MYEPLGQLVRGLRGRDHVIHKLRLSYCNPEDLPPHNHTRDLRTHRDERTRLFLDSTPVHAIGRDLLA